jgi:hypothetical protein
MKKIPSVILVFFCLGILLTGCATKAVQNESAPYADSETLVQSAQHFSAEVKPDRMLVWKAYLTIEVDNVGESTAKTVALAERFKGYVEQKSDSGEESASVRLRIPAASLKDAVGALELLGEVTYRTVSGEDVTEQYIDVEARLKNKIELRDRLRLVLASATEVKDIIAIETELNRVQSDIDSMEGKIKLLRGQVDYASVEVTLQRKQILGPLGIILKGFWWGIKKLFVIRD